MAMPCNIYRHFGASFARLRLPEYRLLMPPTGISRRMAVINAGRAGDATHWRRDGPR